MVGQAIEEGGGHFGVAEDGGPFAEAQIGGDDDAGTLVEPAEQMEQQSAARGAEGQIAELLEDDEIGVDQAAGNLAAPTLGFFLLQGIDQLDGGEEADTLFVVLNGLHAECGGNMGLAGSRPADEHNIVSRLDEVAAMQLPDQGLIDLAAGEVEAARSR